MIDPEFRDQAYQFFIEEARELLQIIESGLLTLRQDPSKNKIHEIMRAAHSIKGGAASVELNVIKTLSHRLEDIFKALYNQEIDTELESLLLQAFDCLRNPLIEQINTGSFDEEAALELAEPILTQIEAKLEDAMQAAEDYIPTSADLGVDLVENIFEVDVAKELESLERAIANPEEYQVAGELRAAAEVLAGFAELLSLPGFGRLANVAEQAVNLHPDRALEITQLALADFNAARDKVLAGDRAEGGSPSAALLAFIESSPSPKTAAELSQTLTESDVSFLETVIETEAGSLDDVFGAWGQGESQDDRVQEREIDVSVISLDDVFGGWGEEESQDDTAPESKSLDNQQEIEVPSLDNVFGSPPEQQPEEENVLVQQGGEIPAPSLDDVFGSSQEELPEEENVLVQQGGEIPAPSLDDVFGSPPEQQPEEENVLVQQGGEIPAPSLDDVFGSSQEELPEEKNFVVEEEADIEILSLDDVFGGSQEDDSFVQQPRKTETPRLDDVFGDFSEQQKEQQSIAKKEEIEVEVNTPTSIKEAVDSIENIFLTLPSVEQAPVPKVATKVAKLVAPSAYSQQKNGTEKQEKKSKAKTPSGKNLSIRVDLSRLEQMNNLVGELTINRNGLALQNEQLQDTVKELLRRFRNFQKIAGSLQELSDRMVIAKERSDRPPRWENGNLPPTNMGVADKEDFDSLEMDSYSQVYTVLQEVLEETLQLEEAVDDVALFAQQSNRTIEEQRQMLVYLRDELMWARMLPLSEVLNRFPRVLRDLCTQYKKNVGLKMTGTSVLVDKAILEKLYDPLVHLLRNAFDHGMEMPEVREQQGKPKQGTIEINSYHKGNQTIVEIKDDGGGIDLDKIVKKAVERGILSAKELDLTTTERLLDLIFEPGFSTAKQVSEISGRGVGLDIVRSQLREIKGTVSVNSVQGKGTTFTLRLPLTLTIAKLLVCSIGSTALALPSDSIEEIIIPQPEQIKRSGKERFLFWQQQVIPIYPLVDLLEYACPIPPTVPSKVLAASVNAPEDWALPLILLRWQDQVFALEIERLVTEQELVIKPLGESISPPSYIYGSTILGDGTLIPTMDGSLLIEYVLGASAAPTVTRGGEVAIASEILQEDPSKEIPLSRQTIKANRVLVVDDSAALRRTLALSLQKAGYMVLQARDGKEALTQLEKNDQVELVICDIEMPNMNGFEFLAQRRKQPKMTGIPVAMLTSRSNPKHRQLAMQLGATAYFTKPYIEQDFLSQIEGLIGKGVSATAAAR